MVNISSVLPDCRISKLLRRLKLRQFFRIHNAGPALIVHRLGGVPVSVVDNLRAVIAHCPVNRRSFPPDLHTVGRRKIIACNFDCQLLVFPPRKDCAAEIILPPAGVLVFPTAWRIAAIKRTYLNKIHQSGMPLFCFDRALSSRRSRTSPSQPGTPRSSPRTRAVPPSV